jgi:hypothetical protein
MTGISSTGERVAEYNRVKKFRVQVEFTVETFGDDIRLADVVANHLQMFGQSPQDLTIEFVKEDK